MTDKKNIFIVSDGTGLTAKRMLDATLAQFKNRMVETEFFQQIQTELQVAEIVNRAAQEKALIAYSLVETRTRNEMVLRGNEKNVMIVDLLGNLIHNLSIFLAMQPEEKPGLSPKIDQDYFKRIDAIGFAVRHDDGLGLSDLDSADVIISGVSRTSKTPVSMYLAYATGLLVANVPLVLDLEPPVELGAVAETKVIGLSINAGVLSEIRRTRLAGLGKVDINYAGIDYVRRDLHYSHKIFRRHPGWTVLDITGKAIEEVAEQIYALIKGRQQAKSLDS